MIFTILFNAAITADEIPSHALECAVCLTDMTIGCNISITKPCKHILHEECMQEILLSRNPTCPLCRTLIVRESKHLIRFRKLNDVTNKMVHHVSLAFMRWFDKVCVMIISFYVAPHFLIYVNPIPDWATENLIALYENIKFFPIIFLLVIMASCPCLFIMDAALLGVVEYLESFSVPMIQTRKMKDRDKQ